MNLLAFDTSTEIMSIAVSRTVDGRVLQWQSTGAGGAQASTGLIAGILDLIHQANLELSALDAICFGSGPGSFTGLRTACSVAQGLAFGAKVPVLPVASLMAVAEEARFTALADQRHGTVTALLDARMDELYCATYAFEANQWTELSAGHLARPEEVVLNPTPVEPAGVRALAGNVFTVYAARLAAPLAAAGAPACITALPTAAAMLRLAPQLLAQGLAVPPEQALPIYIRDKVAKTTVERAAEKAVAQTAAFLAGA
jgi:tRNA threonylcarbamoyladenosine biosynthesis protein TsaB